MKIEGGSSRDGCCGIFPILPFPHLLCIKRKRFFYFYFLLEKSGRFGGNMCVRVR